jgi:hypothetical protein
MTHVHIEGVIYPVVWCHRCDGTRPHHGPYCMSCGADRTEEPPP